MKNANAHREPNSLTPNIKAKQSRQRPGLRQSPAALKALRKRLDREINKGLASLARGEKISGPAIFAEIRERSRNRKRGISPK
jgi:hypothetical protein